MPTITVNAIKLLDRPRFTWGVDAQSATGYFLSFYYQPGTWDGSAFSPLGPPLTASTESTNDPTTVSIGALLQSLLDSINQTMAPAPGDALTLVSGHADDTGVYKSQ